MAAISDTVLIKDVNIFKRRTFQLGSVLIEDGKINTVCSELENVPTIDGSGKYLIPGLIDCHIHVKGERHELEQLASYGITTALDMACWPPSAWQALKQQTTGACDFLTAGIPATCPQSPHAVLFGPDLAEHLISRPEEAAEWVSKRVYEGSDYIKLVADSPIGPTQETLNALVVASHAHGKQVVCHAFNQRAFEMAIDANTDFVTHAPTDQPLTPEYIERMKAFQLMAIPTLVIEESRAKAFKLNYTASRETVKAIYDAGLTVLAGTDATGSLGPHPLPYGSSTHHEYELLFDAGMTTLDVLLGTTERAAKCFGLNDRGVIADGKRADLVLLKVNPLENIQHTMDIERVWCAGIECKRDHVA